MWKNLDVFTMYCLFRVWTRLFTAVCSGAILSDYQRIRVEHVCSRLGLVSLAYLWRRDQAELLDQMVDLGLESVLIKVSQYPLVVCSKGLVIVVILSPRTRL